ncbi:hypothetical protein XF35_38575, partial [Streptomyces platensis subsp. clarensis]|nr:hypothetical protein [Streptomyces platensis subsp. clarensis]
MTTTQLTSGAPPAAPDLVTPAPQPAIRGRSRAGASRLRALDGLRLLAALVVGSAGAVLGFSDNMWAQLLAMAAGITIMLRARLFDYTAQVACLTIAGILTIVLLILGIA